MRSVRQNLIPCAFAQISQKREPCIVNSHGAFKRGIALCTVYSIPPSRVVGSVEEKRHINISALSVSLRRHCQRGLIINRPLPKFKCAKFIFYLIYIPFIRSRHVFFSCSKLFTLYSKSIYSLNYPFRAVL